MNSQNQNRENSEIVVPALMLDHVSKWYGNIVGLNVAILGLVEGIVLG